MMPRCGLSFCDVSMAALECNGNMTKTAKRLGVGVDSLKAAVKRERLHRWFYSRKFGVGLSHLDTSSRKISVSAEQIQHKADLCMSMSEAAAALCISVGYLKNLCKRYSISFAGSRSRSVEIKKTREAL